MYENTTKVGHLETKLCILGGSKIKWTTLLPCQNWNKYIENNNKNSL